MCLTAVPLYRTSQTTCCTQQRVTCGVFDRSFCKTLLFVCLNPLSSWLVWGFFCPLFFFCCCCTDEKLDSLLMIIIKSARFLLHCFFISNPAQPEFTLWNVISVHVVILEPCTKCSAFFLCIYINFEEMFDSKWDRCLFLQWGICVTSGCKWIGARAIYI